MTEIALRQPTAVTPAGIDFTSAQVDTIKNTIAKGATNTELDLFLAICRRTGLDPFLKQIHLIERRTRDGDRWVSSRQPLVGIDGMRLVAKRTGNFDSVDIAWLNDDGEWSEVWKGHGNPVAAKATVYKLHGRPQTAICRYESYVQTTSNGQPNSVWAKSPDNMIAKCAESLALRRAFPAEMSALAASVSINLEDTTAYELEASDEADAWTPEKQVAYDAAADAHRPEVLEAEYTDPADLPFEREDAAGEGDAVIGGSTEAQAPASTEGVSAANASPETPSQPSTAEDRNKILALGKALKWTTPQTLGNVADRRGVAHEGFTLEALSAFEVADVIGWLETLATK